MYFEGTDGEQRDSCEIRLFFFHRIVNETEHIFSHPERSTSILHTQKFLDASNKNSFLNSMSDRSSYLSRATY